VDRHKHPLLRTLKRRLRGVLWRHPSVYRRLFELRHDGRDQFRPSGAFWVVGYQRSGNTFAGLLVDELLFPGRVDFHLHVCSSLRIAADSGRPGVFVIRRPLEAAISTAIFHHWPLIQALEDYIDLHRHWLQEAPEVPVAPFEWFTRNPGAFLREAARLADLTLVSDLVTPEVLERIRVRTEGMFTSADGSLNECQVARPSVYRSRLQHEMAAAARDSRKIQSLLATAESIRRTFLRRSIEPGIVEADAEPALVEAAVASAIQ
jgi:hypothetical protein